MHPALAPIFRHRLERLSEVSAAFYLQIFSSQLTHCKYWYGQIEFEFTLAPVSSPLRLYDEPKYTGS